MAEENEEIENPPAFPKTGNFDENQGSEYDSEDQCGMTLRDYFAAKHLQGVSGDREMWTSMCMDSKGNPVRHIAEESYRMADEMLKARLKK